VSASRPRPARPAQRGPAARRPPPGQQPARGARATGAESAQRAPALAAEWAPLAARVLLGVVVGWFGYHELAQPSLWTGYVPVLPPRSSVAVLAVLAHGWLLLILAAALIAGIATRITAAIAALTLAEIVLSLTMTAGLSDLLLRDLGVLGLAICLTGTTQQHLVLRR
jgi:uncharacterized membrane protein YphA (DoxX/SURF4 family)